jgi:hypothetical protein
MRCVQEEGADQRDHKIRLKQGVQVMGGERWELVGEDNGKEQGR